VKSENLLLDFRRRSCWEGDEQLLGQFAGKALTIARQPQARQHCTKAEVKASLHDAAKSKRCN
jgi:hypothetical protein